MKENKKPELWKRILLYTGIVIITVLAFMISNYFLMEQCFKTIDLDNGEAFNKKTISFSMYHPFLFNVLEYQIDGKDITGDVKYKDSRAVIDLSDLSQGNHVLWIGFKHDYNPLTIKSISLCRKFNVDTISPEITLNSPDTRLIRRKDLYVLGKTEPNTKYRILVNNKSFVGRSDGKGNFYEKVEMGNETNSLKIFTVDKSGNRAEISKEFVLDSTPPHIQIAELSENRETVFNKNEVSLKAEAFDTGSGVRDCYFEFDKQRQKGEFDKETGNIALNLKNLDEGAYRIKVIAEDEAGWQSQKEWNFVIDSREDIGDNKIRPGALGRDVELIQKKLKRMGYLNEVTGKFDDETHKAILKVQKERKLPVTGVVDKITFLAITEKIKIYLPDFALYLFGPDGKLIKKYPIACGSPYYPTPPGEYFVKEKVYYPAWYPPPSPWAKGAKPVPPGPGNPLGTRWIGLNAEIVGIHGTPSSWSIGSASSHGCIRMYIPDVEELFELVSVGTPVSILSHHAPKKKEKELKAPSLKKPGNENPDGGEADAGINI